MRFIRWLFRRYPRMAERLMIIVAKRYQLHSTIRMLLQVAIRPYASLDMRYFRYLYCLERTKSIVGDVAECGLGSGRGMVYIAGYLHANRDVRRYSGFDTFEGFPYISAEDMSGISEERKRFSVVGRYREFGLTHLQRMVRHLGLEARVTFWQGRFEETLPRLAQDQRFSFVFLDCDLYDSYKTALGHLYHRVSEGGIILFDEYERTDEWPGAKKAIDEFFADKPEKPAPMPFGTSWYVQRGANVPALTGAEPASTVAV